MKLWPILNSLMTGCQNENISFGFLQIVFNRTRALIKFHSKILKYFHGSFFEEHFILIGGVKPDPMSLGMLWRVTTTTAAEVWGCFLTSGDLTNINYIPHLPPPSTCVSQEVR
ncbi:hypothetical protein GOODEAATRI_032031 [Goodea atripinnis]|uniref:Uncharacterized protein n=1 Tax=Goodea atripinnis TaxID=208336 RepID=A0ABV0N5Y1_9TELE